ncbi:MAG: hypothetical protein JW716_03985 [Candidatus Aenigmarchaeota archaeon]|nr:hypothetical protein [Candidatus Aenigmarchaeota archaeon]
MTDTKEHKKIAKDDVIRFVLKEVMKEKKRVESQQELTELVKKRLSKTEGATVSAQRLRLLATETPGISILAETREGDVPEKCPVCYRSLKKRKMKNLKGKNIVFGYTCPKCGFESDSTKIAPRKYVFVYDG